jgi:hypothetical protein
MPKHRFATSLKAKPKKTANSPKKLAAKIELRRRILAEISEQGEVAVFDAFAGAGTMYEAVWKDAARYCGCDQEFYRDGPLAYVADNRRLLRCINLGEYNLFDLDAYGSPWQQAAIIASRRRHKSGEKIGMVMTEGTGLKIKLGQIPKIKLGQIPKALASLARVQGPVEGAFRYQSELIDQAIRALADRMNAQISRRLVGRQIHRPGIHNQLNLNNLAPKRHLRLSLQYRTFC